MRHFYVFAAKKVKSFIKSTGDKEALQFCIFKLKSLGEEKEYDFKKIIKLFVPPIVLILKNKLLKKLKLK